jgi:hypothetical protein
VLVVIFGMAIGVFTPLLRRHGRAAAGLLAAVAAILAALAITNLITQDPRVGLAAIEENRRFDLLIAGCELPVVALALISLKRLKKLYWVGWGIHAALTVWLGAVIVWLEFFWHW